MDDENLAMNLSINNEHATFRLTLNGEVLSEARNIPITGLMPQLEALEQISIRHQDHFDSTNFSYEFRLNSPSRANPDSFNVYYDNSKLILNNNSEDTIRLQFGRLKREFRKYCTAVDSLPADAEAEIVENNNPSPRHS